MSKTVLITGSSSGIGKETALYFAERNWKVIATMRNPEKRETGLEKISNLELLHLDVLDPKSVKKAAAHIKEKYGKLDVLVNNAGYALKGIFEASTPEQVAKQFNTNVFGVMEVTRAFLPLFRAQKNGTIINVASIGGRAAFPAYGLYQSTKFALEGFSEALFYELRPFNIKVKIIEPGLIKTDFYSRSMDFAECNIDDYKTLQDNLKKSYAKTELTGSKAIVVARGIYKAAKSKGWRLRYSMGRNAKMILLFKRFLPFRLFSAIIRGQLNVKG